MNEKKTAWIVDDSYGDTCICANEARATRKALEILGNYIMEREKCGILDYEEEFGYIAKGITTLMETGYIDSLVYIKEVEVFE